MTPGEFRKLALQLPKTAECSHMQHPDFRVAGKIFATLAYPNQKWGMVKLTSEQQQEFTQAEPETFVPVKGKWGLRGATSVLLRAARRKSVRQALAAAWCNTAPKELAREFEAKLG